MGNQGLEAGKCKNRGSPVRHCLDFAIILAGYVQNLVYATGWQGTRAQTFACSRNEPQEDLGSVT